MSRAEGPFERGSIDKNIWVNYIKKMLVWRVSLVIPSFLPSALRVTSTLGSQPSCCVRQHYTHVHQSKCIISQTLMWVREVNFCPSKHVQWVSLGFKCQNGTATHGKSWLNLFKKNKNKKQLISVSVRCNIYIYIFNPNWILPSLLSWCGQSWFFPIHSFVILGKGGKNQQHSITVEVITPLETCLSLTD